MRLIQLATKRNITNDKMFLYIENNQLILCGKIFDGRKFRNSPLFILKDRHIGFDLAVEIENRSTWEDPMSEKLDNFINKIWKDAANLHPFFENN